MTLKIDNSSVVCFDLDDTLYNEIDFLRSGYKTIAQLVEKDWQTLLSQMFSLYRTGGDAFQYVSDRFQITKTELLETYRYHKPDIKAFEGVHELFDRIGNSGGKIGVITDGRSVTQRNKLKSLGLMDRLDMVVISEESGFEKPEPSNFIKIQQQFPKRTYHYIGDNFSKDFISPNQLGWKTIALLDNGLNIHNHAFEFAHKEDYRPDYIIERITDIKIDRSLT
ncbi:MAG: HAD family hydrolase [Bacteroidia bacterium]|nr:HAD family hydrolase [Bacteroidia bacterium]MBT8288824.1 HAD family hydrolase [Bacteroidia bacterium]NNK72902.1 HAD family hydrolase [Flavobacteriaceae bacterium]